MTLQMPMWLIFKIDFAEAYVVDLADALLMNEAMSKGYVYDC